MNCNQQFLKNHLFVRIISFARYRVVKEQFEKPFGKKCTLITGRNEVVAKVIFLHLFVILFTGGVYLIPGGVLSPGEGCT